MHESVKPSQLQRKHEPAFVSQSLRILLRRSCHIFWSRMSEFSSWLTSVKHLGWRASETRSTKPPLSLYQVERGHILPCWVQQFTYTPQGQQVSCLSHQCVKIPQWKEAAAAGCLLFWLVSHRATKGSSDKPPQDDSHDYWSVASGNYIQWCNLYHPPALPRCWLHGIYCNHWKG